MADHPIPPFVVLSGKQDEPPITFARNVDGTTQFFQQPEMSGIPCQIQHPMKAGKPKTEEIGMLGCGIIITPDGPIFMIQMQHPDGTSLGAILQPRDYIGFGEIYIPLGVQAQTAMRTIGEPGGKA